MTTVPRPIPARILDCLEANDARATFYMVGNRMGTYQSTVKRMVDMGCEPGSHTWDHTYITKLSQEGLFANLNRLDDTLQSIAGVRTATMRPPGGFVSDGARQNLAKKGVPAILWSIDTLDWKTKNAQNTINVVLSSVKDGDIILMHDLYGTSADAAVVLIPELKKRGYQLVTVSEMASLRGGMTPGTRYITASVHRKKNGSMRDRRRFAYDGAARIRSGQLRLKGGLVCGLFI